MRRHARLALVFALAAAGACRGKDHRTEKKASPPPTPVSPGSIDAAATGELAFVTGTVTIAETRDGQVRPVRLDPETGRWIAQGGGDVHLFPTDVVRKGDLVVIVTEGEFEGAHSEQLAVVRGGAVATFGPRAAMVRNPSSSADGRVLVVESDQTGYRDLFRIDIDGKVTAISHTPEGDFEPSVSPDGAAVAFTSSRDGQSEIYRLPTAGGDATRLTAFQKEDWSPRWSPDGKAIAFLSDREGPPRVFAMAPDGTGQRRVTAETSPDATEDQPRWSPDATRIAYLRQSVGHSALTVIAAAGGAATTLTPDDAVDTDFTWSPDGAYLLATRRSLAGGNIGVPGLVFVRAADGQVMARADATPLALRWTTEVGGVIGPGRRPR